MTHIVEALIAGFEASEIEPRGKDNEKYFFLTDIKLGPCEIPELQQLENKHGTNAIQKIGRLIEQRLSNRGVQMKVHLYSRTLQPTNAADDGWVAGGVASNSRCGIYIEYSCRLNAPALGGRRSDNYALAILRLRLGILLAMLVDSLGEFSPNRKEWNDKVIEMRESKRLKNPQNSDWTAIDWIRSVIYKMKN
ncbi:hypothetical protein LGN17_34820 [Burkholderia sp. AU30280]|uniref:hypothetical protein n=1 Tax=Burkholderia sp. AU30280 TaxID=2879628 RepID=UPI001CF1ED52|nr:hypothetical protein [Burkholderia sp. AU30280]MCA8277660.1 hypothetical protein [Burkholderia sp. AU30280]